MQIEFNQKHRKNQYLCRFRQLLPYYNAFLNTAYNTCSFHIYLSPLQTSRRGRLRHIDPRAVIALLRYPVCGCVAHRPQPLAQVAPPATGGAPIAPQLLSYIFLLFHFFRRGGVSPPAGRGTRPLHARRDTRPRVSADTAGAVSVQSFYKLRCDYLQKGKLAFSCFFRGSEVQWTHERGFDTFTVVLFLQKGKIMLHKKHQAFLSWHIYQIYPRSFYDTNGDGNVNSYGVLLPSRLTSDRCLFSRWKVRTGFLYCIRAIFF